MLIIKKRQLNCKLNSQQLYGEHNDSIVNIRLKLLAQISTFHNYTYLSVTTAIVYIVNR